MAFGELISTMAQVPLTFGCTAVFEAIDPTTGDPVPDVTISDPVVYGHRLNGDGSEPQSITTTVEPLFLPVPTEPAPTEAG